MFPRRIQWLPPNSDGQRRRGENNLLHKRTGVLLQKVTFWPEKHSSEEDMLPDIKETFEKLRAINMKLNPKKCSFGVEERLFLGHLITKQGIKANPSKEFIEALPMVTGPIKGETLVMYLTASEESIRAKLEYLEMEKLILALVYAARRLRRYFQAHPIQVLTDKPIKQVLVRPEKSGRIAKWAIKLGEHEIEFRGHNSIKGQILADFLAKTPSAEDRRMKIKETKRKEPKLENTWKLFTDRASSSDGSRAGLMLVSPEGKEYT
ncbi:reverse transcriptase domain-containing protein [Tanacetum coccineum]